MRLFLGIIIWLAFFLLCPLAALVALVLYPLAWLLLLPFRLLGICTEAVFAFLKALLFLPARVLGWRPALRRAS